MKFKFNKYKLCLLLFPILMIALIFNFNKQINTIENQYKYDINNKYLINNSITLNTNEGHKLNISLKSLNHKDTKYKIYYLINNNIITNNNIEVKYTIDSKDSSTGTISPQEVKHITLYLKNKGKKPANITIGCQGSEIDKKLVLTNGINIEQDIDSHTMAYTYVGKGTSPTKFPSKDDGYYVKNLKCSGGVARWDNETWSLKVLSTKSNEVRCDATIIDKKDLYKDKSGAPYPGIKGSLVPINISSNGTVTKADVTKKWYDYDNKEWANAVILEDETKNYKDGQIIPEDNIESYMVWVPRYKYKLFNVASAKIQQQEIEMQFEDKSIPASLGKQNGEWLTHPAFTSFDVNGIWVGKFESGYKGAMNTKEAEKDVSNSFKLIVKPNVYSWRKISISNAFTTSFNYKRDLNSHMMKNTEWGAVAYLTNSKYGRCTSGSCEDVTINNNQDYITGIAGNTVNDYPSNATTNKWNTSAGQKASTTGNKTGIYDTSGGTFEYVMGYTTSASSVGGNSGLNQEWLDNPQNQKYYDKYIGTTNSSRILGDATGETLKWYLGWDVFVDSSNSWFMRGGHWSDMSSSGSFDFRYREGNAYDSNTFRLVFTT